jgi:hypothetical protein
MRAFLRVKEENEFSGLNGFLNSPKINEKTYVEQYLLRT